MQVSGFFFSRQILQPADELVRAIGALIQFERLGAADLPSAALFADASATA